MAQSFVDKKDRTAAYLEAVAALRKLQEQQPGLVTQAYAEATCDRAQANYVERRQLSPMGGRRCFKRLLGKQCKVGYIDGCECPHSGTLGVTPVSDHDTFWSQNGKPAVLVCQPYQISLEQMREMVAFCDRWGFNATVASGPSWHFPGAVLTVEVRRQGTNLLAAGKKGTRDGE